MSNIQKEKRCHKPWTNDRCSFVASLTLLISTRKNSSGGITGGGVRRNGSKRGGESQLFGKH